MKVFLICIFGATIIIYAFLLISDFINFIVVSKQMKKRKYDMKSVLDRWANAEKQFQKDEEIKNG